MEKLLKLYETKVTERNVIRNSIRNLEGSIASLESAIEDNQQAKDVLVAVGIATQKIFKGCVEDLITTTLTGVFERDYKFIMDIERKYDRTSCNLLIDKGGLILPTKNTMGLGVVDVAALAARLVLMFLEKPRSLPIVWLDEPLKWVHGFEEEASAVVKKLSKGLGVQFIIISQIDSLAMSADKIFAVGMSGGESFAEEMFEEGREIDV